MMGRVSLLGLRSGLIDRGLRIIRLRLWLGVMLRRIIRRSNGARRVQSFYPVSYPFAFVLEDVY